MRIRVTFWMAVGMFLHLAYPLFAQNGSSLAEAFEGRNVLIKIDMPATKDGIDVYPERSTPLDFRSYQARVKNNGISVRQGESILVTKVLVKDKLIEFHLGGGGYGTFGDEGASVSPTYEGPSRREKDLEDRIKRASGGEKRDLERELDSLRRDRERSNARNRAEAAQAQEMAKARIEQKRKEGGSRFNVRYEPRVPASALTPNGLMAALSEWVEFSNAGPAPGMVTRPPDPRNLNSLPILRTGMSRSEVDSILGTPIDVTERNEGAIRVITAVYDVSGVTGKVDFANGVLLKFVYQSR